MKSINLFTVSEAEQQFSQLLELVSAGEDVVIVNRRTKRKFQIIRFEPKLPNDSELKNIHDPV